MSLRLFGTLQGEHVGELGRHPFAEHGHADSAVMSLDSTSNFPQAVNSWPLISRPLNELSLTWFRSVAV